jgi:hypothetical protein
MTGTDTVDLVGHLMPNMFRESDKTTKGLRGANDGFGLAASIVGVIDLIPEGIDGNHADVGTLAGETRQAGLVGELKQ